MAARDLSGGVDTSGFVGVDPVYQNYSDETGKPLNNAEERQAMKDLEWGASGASAVVEAGEAPGEEVPLVVVTNDFGQVVTHGGDGGFSKSTTVESTLTTAELEAQEKAADEADAKAAKADEKAAAKTPAKE